MSNGRALSSTSALDEDDLSFRFTTPTRNVVVDRQDNLVVSCLPLHAATQGAEQASVNVTAIPGEGAAPAALATASLRRPRRAEHESEIWAQLYIDGAFVDVTRATEVDSSADDYVTLLARFGLLTLYLDGERHHVRVCFVGQVSRVVPRATAGNPQTISELAPQAIAEAEFIAQIPGPKIPI